MRILVLGINYAPERTSVAPFTTGLCEHLRREGHEVEVVTAFPYYPEWRIWAGYRWRLWKRERINGVRVRRVWHFVPGRASKLLQRLLHDLSFTMSAFMAGLFVGKFDIVYCSCPPPTISFTAYVLAKLHRKPYIIKLTDLASDAALATGILEDGLAVLLARAIEGFLYRHADRVVCLCQGFVEKLTARGIPREKLLLISDWADTDKIFPIEREESFRKANGISKDQFVVLHTGNMGKKQVLMNVVLAAQLSKDDRDLVWVLVGQGEEKPMLEREIGRRKLPNIRLLPLQPAETLARVYSSADVLLLNQKAAMNDAVIPSKLLTYMAAGRAVLATVNKESEAARQVCDAQCGLIVPAESPQSLVAGALALRRDPALLRAYGKNGRAYAERHYTKNRVLQEYDALFSSYAGNGYRKTVLQEKVASAQRAD